VVEDESLMTLARAIVRGDRTCVSGLLSLAPDLVLARFAVGASRQASEDYFLAEIEHDVYRGDSALHVAAAAFEPGIVRELIGDGALVCAVNRRGAQPLHYAVDGIPGSARWNPIAQRETVLCLIELGADPHAKNGSGSTAWIIQLLRASGYG
jgi:hypothetical protein